ncbi:MAG: Uma2 family endonuclease [Trueperaceae bacterium]|nr:MAG: Uma2 family endonuclease [Trueperaceae bacterium]
MKVRGVRMRGLHFMRLSLCHRREKVHFCRPMHCFPEVWLVNLVERQIEVYSEPADEGYQAQAAHTLTAGFAPQRFPEVTGPWLSEVPLELLA